MFDQTVDGTEQSKRLPITNTVPGSHRGKKWKIRTGREQMKTREKRGMLSEKNVIRENMWTETLVQQSGGIQ